MLTKAELGITGAGGMAEGVWTSMSVNGYWPDFTADAACLISTPVGPLDGSVAQADSPAEMQDTRTAPRNGELHGGTREIDINSRTLETVR